MRLLASCLSFVTALATASAGVLIGTLPTEAHGVSGVLYVHDDVTLSIEQFYYDGYAPAAYPYFYSKGNVPNNAGGGIKISDLLTMRYTGQTLTLTMPSPYTVYNIGWFTIWCEAARQLFTRIQFPDSLPNFNPSTATPTALSFNTSQNCMSLDSSTNLQWTVYNTSVTYTLCGCVDATTTAIEYIGFGLSGSNSVTLMLGADPTITWVDNVGVAHAEDYYLSSYVQCRDGAGACPDVATSGGGCKNNVFNISGSRSNGVQCVTYSRPFDSNDSECDSIIDPSQPQYVVWGVGGLGETAFKHFRRAQATMSPFALSTSSTCQTSLTCTACKPFGATKIVALENKTFVARIGPSGADRGYIAITGQPGWGISWYINDTLVPELVVQRGQTYTFIVEGGNNASTTALYHPFYITNSPSGGRLQNTPLQQASEVVYAGFQGNSTPTGVGRYCEYAENPLAENLRTSCGAFEDYFKALNVSCSAGESGVVIWTPDETTPDTVYYQCATHLNIGWKITVTNPDSDNFVAKVVAAVVVPVLAVALLIAVSVVVGVAVWRLRCRGKNVLRLGGEKSGYVHYKENNAVNAYM
ncbi:hypothetical protein EMCRGX_G031668 [Ephydatia muelleri]